MRGERGAWTSGSSERASTRGMRDANPPSPRARPPIGPFRRGRRPGAASLDRLSVPARPACASPSPHALTEVLGRKQDSRRSISSRSTSGANRRLRSVRIAALARERERCVPGDLARELQRAGVQVFRLDHQVHETHALRALGVDIASDVKGSAVPATPQTSMNLRSPA